MALAIVLLATPRPSLKPTLLADNNNEILIYSDEMPLPGGERETFMLENDKT